MIEDTRNIRSVCDAHAPKPNQRLSEKNPKFFVGKFVKKGFPTGLPKGRPPMEHMWVRVEKVVAGELVGKLNNDPTCFPPDVLKDGDPVTVQMHEIEEVTE